MNHLNIAIYIKVEKQNEIENRDLYMKFIGSQTHVKCGCHKYHLITDRNNEKECVTDGCDNKVANSCPELQCKVKICKKCFKALPRNNQNEIFSRNMNMMLGTNYNEAIESDSSNVSINSEELIEPYESSEDDSSLNEIDFELTHDDLINDTLKEAKIDGDNIDKIDMDFIGDTLDDNNLEEQNEENELFNELIPTTNALLRAKKFLLKMRIG